MTNEKFNKDFYKIIHLMTDELFTSKHAIKKIGYKQNYFLNNLNPEQKELFELAKEFVKQKQANKVINKIN